MSPLRLGLLLAGASLLILGAIGLALVAQGDAANARSTFAVGVIVAATSGSSAVYRVAGWSLRTQSIVHFAIMVATVLPALMLSGWFPLANAVDYVIVVGIFLLVGLALWLVFYLLFGVIVPRQRARRR